MTPSFDVAIVGGGPGGSACAAICAQGGLRTVVVERARFPREKVCGDCLNPVALPSIEALGLGERLRGLPHARLREVEFVGCDRRIVTVPLPENGADELAIKRSHLDELLLTRASEVGAEVRQETAVTRIESREQGWNLTAGNGNITSRWLVAADGRNSTVARLLGLLPNARKDRVGLQTHLPLPDDLNGRVRMQFVPQGYTGIADVGNGVGNLCLVARPHELDAIRSWAVARYKLRDSHEWRSVTPLARDPIPPVRDRLLLIGDAARVVEPFTGEGIAYALLTGIAAGRALLGGQLEQYEHAHREIYAGRLWVNHLARFACLHPYAATTIIRLAGFHPGVLSFLTRKVIGVNER